MAGLHTVTRSRVTGLLVLLIAVTFHCYAIRKDATVSNVRQVWPTVLTVGSDGSGALFYQFGTGPIQSHTILGHLQCIPLAGYFN